MLGNHVHQKGSLVNDERLRFDFSHDSAVSPAEIRQIEHIVNTEILKNTEVTTEVMDMEQAKVMGAMALFGKRLSQLQIFVLKILLSMQLLELGVVRINLHQHLLQ